MNIYEKLQSARLELQATKIEKTGHNTFSNYYYMELADFLIPTQDLFQKHKLCGVVSFTKELATLTITDMEEMDRQIVITSPMGSANLKACHEVQNIGAVETYQRRYLWVTAMEIVEHDALDATTGDDKQSPKDKVTPSEKIAAKPKPDIALNPVSEKEMEITITMLKGAENVIELQSVFSAIWKRATKEQRTLLKPAYDERKTNLQISSGEQA